MARIWSSGAELNSVTAEVEYDLHQDVNSSTVVRSGSFSAESSNSAGNENILYNYAAANLADNLFFRIYLKVEVRPGSLTPVIRLLDSGATEQISLRMNTNGSLELWDGEDNAQVGSDSPILNLNTWYRIEINYDSTTVAATILDARIDGVSFASGTVNHANGSVRFGIANNSVTMTVYADDWAINDDSGSFQNSYPGEGKIVHHRPNAAGDNADWTGAYTDVDEVTPDDATTLLSSNTLDQIEDMNIDSPVYLGDQDTINVVAVGCRFNGVGASANASFVLRIKASASGTVEESSAITPADATWVTNAAAAPRNYSLVLYDLPGASTTVWTKNDLENAQIGVRLSATSTNAAQVSTLWLLVDYVPVFGPHKAKPKKAFINYNI